VTKFKANFLASDGEIVVNELPADAMAAGTEGAETVTRVRPPKR
jgi:hypothetical protein